MTMSVLVNSALILTLLKRVGLNLENEEENLPCIKAFLIECVRKIPKQKHGIILK